MKKKNDLKSMDKNLEVTIHTTQGTWETEFPKTIKVQDVINAIISHFNFAQNGSYELRLDEDPNTPLQANRPLVSYGVEDGDVLIFTDLGVAV